MIVGADGKLVASEAGYGSFKLWEGDTGRPVPLWEGLTKPVPGREPVRFTLTSAGGRLTAVLWGGEAAALSTR